MKFFAYTKCTLEGPPVFVIVGSPLMDTAGYRFESESIEAVVDSAQTSFKDKFEEGVQFEIEFVTQEKVLLQKDVVPEMVFPIKSGEQKQFLMVWANKSE